MQDSTSLKKVGEHPLVEKDKVPITQKNLDILISNSQQVVNNQGAAAGPKGPTSVRVGPHSKFGGSQYSFRRAAGNDNICPDHKKNYVNFC